MAKFLRLFKRVYACNFFFFFLLRQRAVVTGPLASQVIAFEWITGI